MTSNTRSGNNRPPPIVLPTPEYLEQLTDQLPEPVMGILRTMMLQNLSDIADLAALIPEAIPVSPDSSELVSLTDPKEIAYDEYFGVGRSTDKPRLRMALAFLRSVRAAALNAGLGHDLEPAAVADLLKSIRVMAGLIAGFPDQSSAAQPWPDGTWPSGPW